MADRARLRGLLDTSVVIDLDVLDRDDLPATPAISAITLAELAAGPATVTGMQRAVRQDRLQRVESVFSPLPFDVGAARAFGLVATAVVSRGRKARGARMADLLVAANALSDGLPLFTRNPADFRGLEGLIDIVVV